jgi:hypothetical protein
MLSVVYEIGNSLCSDETNFYINGHIKTQHCCVWREKQPYEVYEHVRDSARVNAWCRIMHDHVVGSLFCAENTITVNIYLDMLPLFVFPH